MNKEIHAKIIKLLSNTEVIINKGRNDGVKVDMIFGIKLNLPDIVDPDDENNILSGVYYEKGEIRINSVFERMSFAKLIPKKSYSMLTFETVDWLPKDEYPKLSGEVLLTDEAWNIKVGDEVFLKRKAEEEKSDQK